MVDYNRLEVALDLLAEDIERQATKLRLVKVAYSHEYEKQIQEVRNGLHNVNTRLLALLVDLDLQ